LTTSILTWVTIMENSMWYTPGWWGRGFVSTILLTMTTSLTDFPCNLRDSIQIRNYPEFIDQCSLMLRPGGLIDLLEIDYLVYVFGCRRHSNRAS
jgi:hypothetical protein